MNKDFVLYYRLADDLLGRIAVVSYKPAPDKAGTFMMVVMPGLDLQPLNRGADYVFVLDTIFLNSATALMVPVPLAHIIGFSVGYLAALLQSDNHTFGFGIEEMSLVHEDG